MGRVLRREVIVTTPRLPIRDIEAENRARWNAQTHLLREIEYERDPPLTERERWQEELGRQSYASRGKVRRP